MTDLTDSIILGGDYGDYESGENSTSSSSQSCKACETRGQSRPSQPQFHKYLSWFLQDNPGEQCPKAGHAAYGDGVRMGSITSPTTNSTSTGNLA